MSPRKSLIYFCAVTTNCERILTTLNLRADFVSEKTNGPLIVRIGHKRRLNGQGVWRRQQERTEFGLIGWSRKSFCRR